MLSFYVEHDHEPLSINVGGIFVRTVLQIETKKLLGIDTDVHFSEYSVPG